MPSSLKNPRLAVRVALVALLGALLTTGAASASSYTITLDGTPLNVATTTSAEKATISLTGTAGHRLSVRVSQATITNYTVSIKKPDGTLLKSAGPWGVAGGFINPVTMPADGTYKIQLAPATGKGTAVVQAWDVPANLTSTIPTDGTVTTQTYTAGGQNGSLTFTGSVGQRITLMAGAGTTTLKNTAVSIKAPSGASVLASTGVGFAGGFYGPFTLAENGTYTISSNPPTYSTGSVDFQLWSVPADQAGTLTIGGGAQALSFATPGQNASLTFAGTSGQKVTLAITPVSLSGVNAATVKVRKPDNTVLSTIAVTNSGALMEPISLPTTGTYTVSVDPTAQATGSISLNLFLSPADGSGTLVSGTPTTVTLGSAGQNASYTISGTAGQYLSVRFANDSFSSLKASVTGPGNTTLMAAKTFGSGGQFFDGVALPTTGTYKVVIDPQGVSTGAADVTALLYANPLVQAVTPGTPQTVTTIAGQNAQLTFTATAKMSFLFTNVTDGSTSVSGINATLTQGSTTVTTFTFGNSDKYLDTLTLTAGATYKLLLDPQGANAGSITATVYSVPADATVAGTLGSTSAVSVGTPGQGAKVTFAGTAGHSFSAWFSSVTIGSSLFNPTAVKLLSPTGTTVASFSLYAHDTMFDPVLLPATGTYTLAFDPNGSNTGGFNVGIYDVPAAATATATIGGGNATATTTVPGQLGQVSFTSTSATTVTISYDVSNTFTSAVTVLNGSTVVRTAQTMTAGDSFTFTPAAGTNTYTIKVDPTVNNVGALVVSVS
jgi:hypothetical protein